MVRVSFGLLVLVVFGVPAAQGAVIWSDNFESGKLDAWTSVEGNWAVVTSAQSARSGVAGLDIKGNTAPLDDLLSVNISSLGYEHIEVSYWFKVRDALELADSVLVEWTANSTDWFPLASYQSLSASDWQEARFFLPSAADQNPTLGLRLRANLGGTTDRMNFDEIVVTGQVVPEPSSLLAGVWASGLLLLRRRK